VTAIKSQHSRLFEQLMDQRKLTIVAAILLGQSEATYRELVGEFRGLEAALKLSEEADFKLSGDEPSADPTR
jgi:hypothetical protein